jgi:hypothetical protein
MKTQYFITSVALAATIIISGCTTPYGQPDRTATGALAGGMIGAGTGALIGNAAGHHTATGAAVGGILGLATGALIGNAMDQQHRAALAAHAPQTLQRIDQGQPLGVADIKALAKAGVSDEVIISQIRSSRVAFRLTTAEIIDLKDSGVSQKVIDFMINTPNAINAPPPASTPTGSVPPPPTTVVTDPVVVSPGPDYVWVSGYWAWDGFRWVWVSGSWVLPPYSGAVWIGGYWRGGIWYRGYWGHGPHGGHGPHWGPGRRH